MADVEDIMVAYLGLEPQQHHVLVPLLWKDGQQQGWSEKSWRLTFDKRETGAVHLP
jgi:hypothetical protein